MKKVIAVNRTKRFYKLDQHQRNWVRFYIQDLERCSESYFNRVVASVPKRVPWRHLGNQWGGYDKP